MITSRTAKQRRTAPVSGEALLRQQQQQQHGQKTMNQQAHQRQANVKNYSDTMRMEMKHTRRNLILKLLVLPLVVMVIGTLSIAMIIQNGDEKRTKANVNSNDTPLNDHLSSFSSSGKTNTKQKQKPGVTTVGRDPVALDNTQNQHQQPLPKWITEYVQWHQEMRAKFPGDDLFTKEDAPKLLVRTCLGLCGGLHDRLGQLPWDIYLAMRLKRVLLIAWQRPKELEHFLLPPVIDDDDNAGTLSVDWTIPESQKFGFIDVKRVRAQVTELFDDNLDRNPGEGDFWNKGFEKAMIRAGAPPSPTEDLFKKEAKFVETRILRHRLLGHLDENILEERLEKEGYYKDEAHWKASDLHKAPTFGAVWEIFFRPSQAVRTEIINVMGEMGLLKENSAEGRISPNAFPPTVPYKAVHCRVRHPKAHPLGTVVKGKNEKYPADKTGLPWVEGGAERAFALETANKALVCARNIPLSDTTLAQPVYFLSDSNDLVNHVAIELANSTYLAEHESNSSWVLKPLLQTVRSQLIVARNTTLENAHIDRQKGRLPPAYYATFVDLYLAMKAQCVVYGIGYYAAFAAKISGTDCAYLYAKESWGAQVEKSAHICPNEP